MATAVLSDLHLGSRASILGTPAVREGLFEALTSADELVLLGDVLSLREAPIRDVMAAARPVLRGLGEAMAGRRIVIVPGNHDHRLAEPLLEAEAPLGLERVVPASDELDSDFGEADVAIAYPGYWIRPDVLAVHGHYLDCHLSVPRLESLLAAVSQGLVGVLPGERLRAEDYEAVLAPIYAFAYRQAQGGSSNGRRAPLASVGGRVRASAWDLVAGRGGLGRAPGLAVSGTLALGAIAVLNRAGLGPFRAALSRAELHGAGLRAMAEVLRRLAVEADHVIFGHTHRAGPLVDEAEWSFGGARLHNAGSWLHEPPLIGGMGVASPYWPGRLLLVGEGGPPELRSPLDEPAMPATR